MNFFRYVDLNHNWKNNFWFHVLTGSGLILFALLVLFNPVILVVLFSAAVMYIGTFFIGSAFLIRRFGKESEKLNNWHNARTWFWQWP